MLSDPLGFRCMLVGCCGGSNDLTERTVTSLSATKGWHLDIIRLVRPELSDLKCRTSLSPPNDMSDRGTDDTRAGLRKLLLSADDVDELVDAVDGLIPPP